MGYIDAGVCFSEDMKNFRVSNKRQTVEKQIESNAHVDGRNETRPLLYIPLQPLYHSWTGRAQHEV